MVAVLLVLENFILKVSMVVDGEISTFIVWGSKNF